MAFPIIHGYVLPGFESVYAEFERNFIERGEIGAACAIYLRGEKVVDLWGGFRDALTCAPWEQDTLIGVFSTTKGMASLAVAAAHSKGLLDYDEKVATYWPEFAQNGKGAITVRQLLAHQAGLSAIDAALDSTTLADLDFVARAIARQKPAWEPGLYHGYHAVSLGWYEGELIRRVDPQHRSLGQFFRDEIAAPLHEEFYIGLPDDVSDSRIAVLKGFHPLEMLLHMNHMPMGMVLRFLNPGSITARTMSNPKLSAPAEFFSPAYRKVEIPSANGIGLVRSLAHIYSVFATDGAELAIREETLRLLAAPACPPKRTRHDRVLHVDTSFSLGLIKPFDRFRFGSSEGAFGTMGAGGSFAFADPDQQVGFAYAMNRMGFHLWDDLREKSLRDAFYRCIL